MLGETPGLFGINTASVVVLNGQYMFHCTCYYVQCTGCFHVACIFRLPTPSPRNFTVLFIIYPVDSPLSFQFSVTGAGAEAGIGFLWKVGLVPGLQVGQAHRCSCYLGLGSAVSAPMLLGNQPPYAATALTFEKSAL